MCEEEKYGWLFEMIDVTPIVRVLGKIKILDAPEMLKYQAFFFAIHTFDRKSCQKV
jgi:hypothetical protein